MTFFGLVHAPHTVGGPRAASDGVRAAALSTAQGTAALTHCPRDVSPPRRNQRGRSEQ